MENKIFLYDFITIPKIKKNIFYIVIFTLLTYQLFNHLHLVMHSDVCKLTGVIIAFSSTAYTIYTYSIEVKIRQYIMLPIKKSRLFLGYFEALLLYTLLQRISFLIIVVLQVADDKWNAVLFILVNSTVAVMINVGALLSKNSHRKFLLMVYIFMIVGLIAVNVYISQTGPAVILILLFGVISWVLIQNFRVSDLIIKNNALDKVRHSHLMNNYFLKTMIAEKIYFTNTMCIVAFLIILLVLSRTNPIMENICWLVGAVNTPITTMISGDLYIMRHLQMLPNKGCTIRREYKKCLLLYFLIINSIILAAKGVFFQNIRISDWMLASFVTILEVFLVDMLETKYPIKNWQTKQELWKNPRKYILPAVIFLIVTCLHIIRNFTE